MTKVTTGADAKRAREALGASQTGVAAAIGMNRTYYSLFEAGRYVLDEKQQGRLHEFLVDSPPTAGTAIKPEADDDHDDLPATAPTEPSRDHTAAAIQALDVLRNVAAEPGGLRSKRTAAAVHNATTALQPLEYAEMLAIARERGVPVIALPSFDAFKNFDGPAAMLWESRAGGLLVCDALYGARWNSIQHDGLMAAVNFLRATLGETHVRYSDTTLGEEIFGDYDARTPLRRAELAPFVVEAAQQRTAPPF